MRAFLIAALLLLLPHLALAEAALVTGANAGIGLEFAKQYAAQGWTVIATHRRDAMPDSLKELTAKFPAKVLVERLDVQDNAAIDALAKKYRSLAIDVLLNNAALAGSQIYGDQQKFGSLNYELFDRFMHTNAQGPLKMSEAFLENVKRSKLKRIVVISSRSGSLGDGVSGTPGGVFYRISKAATNMAMVNVAASVKADGVLVGIFHPGSVATERMADLDLPQETRAHLMPPSESVASMIRVIAGLTPDKSGVFLNWKGDVIPW
ncbi:MAG: SDR family oxidoreductase [Rhodospirillaceae bacterium]|nr:SDR family oxidoreductase [Rhodospirillaceae bacterium]